jgi:hypothetical protein
MKVFTEEIKICTLNSNLVNSLFKSNLFNCFKSKILILTTNNEKVFINLLQEISVFYLICYKKIFINLNSNNYYDIYNKYHNNYFDIYINIYL